MVVRYSPVLKRDDGSCFDIGCRPIPYVEMEKWGSGTYVLYDDYAKLEAENKALKEALEVYSDESNWNAQYRSKSKHDFQPQTLMHEFFNGYEIAQKALSNL